MAVFVLDKHQRPLMPATEKRARLLLARGRAVVVKRYPFTIRLKDRIGGQLQPIQIKLDPGSKTTGMAVIREQAAVAAETGDRLKPITVLSLFHLQHRGYAIGENLRARAGFRKRRSYHLRYRKERFSNRKKPEGWLAPSLRHRIDSTLRWVDKIRRLAPVTGIVQELARFDTQKMANPEIQGIDYQQGTLQGYAVREYLLEKWGRTCAYCDKTGVPLQVEHIVARVKGGSDRVANLTLSCEPCNQAKNALPVEQFLQHDPARLHRLLAQAKAPLRDAAAVNSTRRALFKALKSTGLAVTTGLGAQTKFNRAQYGIPKSHALDAACVGQLDGIDNWNLPTLAINCMGRGSYQRTRLTKHGFPRGYLMRRKSVRGFQTGDIVKAVVTQGKKAGEYQGRVAVRASGSFNITTAAGVIQGISYRFCRLIARNDGYHYVFQPKIAN
jgi:5-methylcytosine-specific restriction endonuclease McrA